MSRWFGLSTVLLIALCAALCSTGACDGLLRAGAGGTCLDPPCSGGHPTQGWWLNPRERQVGVDLSWDLRQAATATDHLVKEFLWMGGGGNPDTSHRTWLGAAQSWLHLPKGKQRHGVTSRHGKPIKGHGIFGHVDVSSWFKPAKRVEETAISTRQRSATHHGNFEALDLTPWLADSTLPDEPVPPDILPVWDPGTAHLEPGHEDIPKLYLSALKDALPTDGPGDWEEEDGTLPKRIAKAYSRWIATLRRRQNRQLIGRSILSTAEAPSSGDVINPDDVPDPDPDDVPNPRGNPNSASAPAGGPENQPPFPPPPRPPGAVGSVDEGGQLDPSSPPPLMEPPSPSPPPPEVPLSEPPSPESPLSEPPSPELPSNEPPSPEVLLSDPPPPEILLSDPPPPALPLSNPPPLIPLGLWPPAPDDVIGLSPPPIFPLGLGPPAPDDVSGLTLPPSTPLGLEPPAPDDVSGLTPDLQGPPPSPPADLLPSPPYDGGDLLGLVPPAPIVGEMWPPQSMAPPAPVFLDGGGGIIGGGGGGGGGGPSLGQLLPGAPPSPEELPLTPLPPPSLANLLLLSPPPPDQGASPPPVVNSTAYPPTPGIGSAVPPPPGAVKPVDVTVPSLDPMAYPPPPPAYPYGSNSPPGGPPNMTTPPPPSTSAFMVGLNGDGSSTPFAPYPPPPLSPPPPNLNSDAANGLIPALGGTTIASSLTGTTAGSTLVGNGLSPGTTPAVVGGDQSLAGVIPILSDPAEAKNILAKMSEKFPPAAAAAGTGEAAAAKADAEAGKDAKNGTASDKNATDAGSAAGPNSAPPGSTGGANITSTTLEQLGFARRPVEDQQCENHNNMDVYTTQTSPATLGGRRLLFQAPSTWLGRHLQQEGPDPASHEPSPGAPTKSGNGLCCCSVGDPYRKQAGGCCEACKLAASEYTHYMDSDLNPDRPTRNV